MRKGRLVLSNGLVMEGLAIGASGTSVGELVFNTAMSGYQEVLTDPSYCQQVITFTSPHIGNVGMNQQDMESDKTWCSGLVIRQLSKGEANWRSETSLSDFLTEKNIVGLSDIDTRHLTHILREEGAQSVCITTELNDDEALACARDFSGLEAQDLASVVSTSEMYHWNKSSQEWAIGASVESFCHVVVFDFGVKHNILKLLVDAGASVTVVNAKTSVEEVLALKPDGVFLSNGPGDPSACDYAIKNVQELLKTNIPMFGICLGFQLLALALGAKTKKMKFGHHGANHPVIDLETKKIHISSQNHGFMVDEATLLEGISITHRSLFDDTIQGIMMDNAFGFQGHPEASPGPHDVMPLFAKFLELITLNKKV